MESVAHTQPGAIAASDRLSPTIIRILVVIDGRIFPAKTTAFGLGHVLETLRDNWSWWIRFEVDIATREASISPAMLDGNTVKYRAFKFSQGFVVPTVPGVPVPEGPHNGPSFFDIDRYDQIWLFADQPNDTDGSDLTTDAHILAPYKLDEIELRVLAEWMDRGGGVFATGDHGVLGAAMCSRIPRVGTMRKWT